MTKITNTPKKQLPLFEEAILKALPKGKGRLKKAKELSQELGVGTRSIYECIHRMITEYGIPVASTRRYGGGYWIPQTPEELAEGMAGLKAQHREEAKRLKALENADLEAYKAYLEGGA